MRGAPIRIRTFLLGSVLTLLVLSTLAGLAGWRIERHHQQSAAQQRLDTAITYLTKHRTGMQMPGNLDAFAALLDRLGLFAQLNLIMKVPPGKTQLYVSPALRATNLQQAEAGAKADRAKAGLLHTNAPAAPAKSPAARDQAVEEVIPVVTRDSAGALTADLYYAPASRSSQALAALLAGLGVLVAGLVALLWLAGRWMVRPLTRLSSQVDKVAGGDLGISVPRSRIGEIANIAQAVDGMTIALGETAQRRAEADEARRFLVTGIAHDLRTPLFALRGHLQAIRSRLGDPSLHLARAEARADALERLVGNLFAFTREDYLEPAPQLEAVRVGDLLEEVTAGLELTARLGGNSFELDGDRTIAVNVDRNRVKRALDNILDNAVRYSPPGAAIRLAWACQDASTVELAVRDLGPGIDPGLLPHIFEPGIRDTTSSTNGQVGGGLGLAIAKRLLEAQHAGVSARNLRDGGAEIRVSLPRAPFGGSNGPESLGR